MIAMLQLMPLFQGLISLASRSLRKGGVPGCVRLAIARGKHHPEIDTWWPVIIGANIGIV